MCIVSALFDIIVPFFVFAPPPPIKIRSAALDHRSKGAGGAAARPGGTWNIDEPPKTL